MQRYFATLKDGFVVLHSDDERHLLLVMRARVGEEIEVVIDGKVSLCTISQIKPLILSIKELLQENNENPIDITLLFCLPKGDKLDLVVQKATELGVAHIIVVQSARSMVKWTPDHIQNKIERFKKIIKEASEQSKRNVIPTISTILDFSEAIHVPFDLKLIASEHHRLSGTSLTSNIITSNISSIGVLIGPEGGFEPAEIENAISHRYKPFSLGKRILRSETAAIASLVLIDNLVNHVNIF